MRVDAVLGQQGAGSRLPGEGGAHGVAEVRAQPAQENGQAACQHKVVCAMLERIALPQMLDILLM